MVTRIAQQLCSSLVSEHLAEQEAWWMVEAITGRSKSALCAMHELMLSPAQQELLDDWIRQRIEDKKPLQYILGSVPFCDLSLRVRPPVLIPRPETEEWVTWLIDVLKQRCQQPLRILDLCSGSGCIALALAHHFPQATVVGVDINPEAIALALENRALSALHNVSFVQSDLYQNLGDASFDLIVSNPPYISEAEYEYLTDDVKQWEDRRALVADDNGMHLYSRIIAQARAHLDQGQHLLLHQEIPVLVCEIGPAQYDALEAVLHEHGFKKNRFFRDIQGVIRWVASYI